MKATGNNLKAIRKNQQMTGVELASLVGVSHSMIYMIENGDRTPGMTLAKRIADALGKSIEDIFFNHNCHNALLKE